MLGLCMQQMCLDNFHNCFSLTCFLTPGHHSPCRTKGKNAARVVFKMLKFWSWSESLQLAKSSNWVNGWSRFNCQLQDPLSFKDLCPTFTRAYWLLKQKQGVNSFMTSSWDEWEMKAAWKSFNRDDVEKFPHKILLRIKVIRKSSDRLRS